MGQEIITVKNKKELEKATEEAIMEGFRIDNRSNNITTLNKQGNLGNIGIHIVIFIFFGWWTLLLANLLYAAYSYMSKTRNRMIRIQ